MAGFLDQARTPSRRHLLPPPGYAAFSAYQLACFGIFGARISPSVRFFRPCCIFGRNGAPASLWRHCGSTFYLPLAPPCLPTTCGNVIDTVLALSRSARRSVGITNQPLLTGCVDIHYYWDNFPPDTLRRFAVRLRARMRARFAATAIRRTPARGAASTTTTLDGSDRPQRR